MKNVSFVPPEIAKETTKDYNINVPFFIFDEEKIRQNMRILNIVFSWNSGYKNYFPVSTAPIPAILKILKEEGCGVCCSSRFDLELVKRCGFSGNEILFKAANATISDYKLAHELNAITVIQDKLTFENAYNNELISDSFTIFQCEEDELQSKYLDFAYKARRKGACYFGLFADTNCEAKEVENNPFYHLSSALEKCYDLSLMGINVSYVDFLREGEKGCLNLLSTSDLLSLSSGLKEIYQTRIVFKNLIYPALFTEFGFLLTNNCGEFVMESKDINSPYPDSIGLVDEFSDSIVKIGNDFAAIPGNEKFFTFLKSNSSANLNFQYVLRKSNGTFELIKRSETLDDLFATLIF